jgi:uncharacterized protein (TIGR04255 family)
MTLTTYHFPKDVRLETRPLLEAWLELRWELEDLAPPHMQRDPLYPFALGRFLDAVRSRYPVREDLEASRAPQEVLPHVVRHRFWSGDKQWPVLQLGPGVATVNFIRPYTWDKFKDEALFLRSCVLSSYRDQIPKIEAAVLTYRNGVPFQYTDDSVLDFLRENLNTVVQLPRHIPGAPSGKEAPTSANLAFTFDLISPNGTGRVQVGTATGRLPDSHMENEVDELVVWELEVASRASVAPQLVGDLEFTEWLASAHAAIHEWFFSLIDGRLFKSYKGGYENAASASDSAEA